MHPQHAIAGPVGPIRGVGLFSGRRSSVWILPGAANAGIVFRTRAGVEVVPSPSGVSYVASWAGLPPGVPVRNTTLRAPGPGGTVAFVATIEHLMSALAGLGVWDAIVEIDADEVPILDGSALAFVDAIRPLLADTRSPRRGIVLEREVTVRRADACIRATPSRDGVPRFTYELDYGPGAPIPPSSASWAGSPEEYAASVAPARTFSLEQEAKAARSMGLFAHLTPRDMLVIGADGTPIDNRWRFPDEPARHKLLDLIGDLALLGAPLVADVVASRAGHALTHEFVREVLGSGQA